MLTLVNCYIQIVNLRVNIRMVSLKYKIKLETIFRFIYAAKVFCTNKSYAVKELIIIFQLLVSVTLLLIVLCPATLISHKFLEAEC
jgi:hypothetical protein